VGSLNELLDNELNRILEIKNRLANFKGELDTEREMSDYFHKMHKSNDSSDQD